MCSAPKRAVAVLQTGVPVQGIDLGHEHVDYDPADARPTFLRLGFRLHGSGGGEFVIRAEASLHSGGIARLEKWLELRGAGGERPSDRAGAGGRRPTVFISARALDGEIAFVASSDRRAPVLER